MSLNRVALLLFGVLFLSTFYAVTSTRNGEWLKDLFGYDDDGDEETAPESTPSSRAELQGWFKIFVVGTGHACFTKDYQKGLFELEQFGNTTATEAFIEFFGEAECEPGDWGLAYGKIRASVVAAAYERGQECLSTVITSVITDPFHQYSKGDVDVHISGEVVGEAVALCEQNRHHNTNVVV